MRQAVIDRQEGVADPVALVEEIITDHEGLIYGKPDRIDTTEQGDRIVDLKSGWGGGAELPENYRRQLLLYAYLWKEHTGTWPSQAAIQALNGQVTTITVQPSEAEALVKGLLTARETANRRIEDGIDPFDLATPSEETCRYCQFRPQCASYFSALSASWDSMPASLVGKVARVESTESAKVLTIEVERSNLDTAVQAVRVIDAPAVLDISVGQVISVVDASHTPRNDHVRWRRWTRLSVIGT